MKVFYKVQDIVISDSNQNSVLNNKFHNNLRSLRIFDPVDCSDEEISHEQKKLIAEKELKLLNFFICFMDVPINLESFFVLSVY